MLVGLLDQMDKKPERRRRLGDIDPRYCTDVPRNIEVSEHPKLCVEIVQPSAEITLCTLSMGDWESFEKWKQL